MSVAVVNHGIHRVCSVFAIIRLVQILHHLWALVDRHEFWDEEIGVS